MPNAPDIHIPNTLWIGIIGLIGLLVAIVGFFFTKFFKDVKEKFDILFRRQRHQDIFLIKKFNDYDPCE